MSSVLGALSPAVFLRDYWQKRPLLIRQALPNFAGLVERDQLLALATREGVISRLVIEHPRRRARWERHDGPFDTLDGLPDAHWTLLVHGVESLVPGGWELLRQFSFLPAARIDDLMVSYAAQDGSVGPHDDLYNVFLLQGPGRRRWQISRGGTREVDPHAAIKVLRSFHAEEEWVLQPGDMLYLPPGIAHHGVAEGPCFTYSIGFLAPSHQDLVQSFLGYLAQALPVDPNALAEHAPIQLQKNPFALDDAMVAEVAAVIGGIKWDAALVEDFFGCFLTRPKPHALFYPPLRPLSLDGFARRLRGRGRLTLALPTRGLVRGDRLFLNGEAHHANRATLRRFGELVSARYLPLPLDHAELFHDWYNRGWLGVSR